MSRFFMTLFFVGTFWLSASGAMGGSIRPDDSQIIRIPDNPDRAIPEITFVEDTDSAENLVTEEADSSTEDISTSEDSGIFFSKIGSDINFVRSVFIVAILVICVFLIFITVISIRSHGLKMEILAYMYQDKKGSEIVNDNVLSLKNLLLPALKRSDLFFQWIHSVFMIQSYYEQIREVKSKMNIDITNEGLSALRDPLIQWMAREAELAEQLNIPSFADTNNDLMNAKKTLYREKRSSSSPPPKE